MNFSVSAVMAVFNGEKYIHMAIESLLNQSLSLEKIYIIDDGSTDATVSVISQLLESNPSLELIENKVNRGVSYSRNKGSMLVNSTWILFLDADDVLENDLLEQASKNEIYEKDVLIHSAFRQINHASNIISEPSRFKYVEEQEMLGYQFVRNVIYLSGTIVRTSVFNACGGFNEQISICEDWDLWLKIAQKGRCIYIDKVLVSVRRHNCNVSSEVKSFINPSKEILNQYTLSFIKQAIDKRNLPKVDNLVDYVSLLFQLEHWEDGFEILIKSTEDHATHSKLNFYIGIYYFHQNKIRDAESYFRRSTNLNSIDAAGWNNLGVCLAMQGSNNESSACFTKALSINKNYLDAKRNIIDLDDENFFGTYKITNTQLRPVLLNYQN